MINLEGKVYYTFLEASQETGYTIGTIRTYVSEGKIEGEKLQDGFVLTEYGMKQLRIRKSREDNTVVPLSPPTTEKESDISMVERSLHFRTSEALQLYDRLTEYAEKKGSTSQKLGHHIIEEYLNKKQEILDKIELLEAQKRELMEQL